MDLKLELLAAERASEMRKAKGLPGFAPDAALALLIEGAPVDVAGSRREVLAAVGGLDADDDEDDDEVATSNPEGKGKGRAVEEVEEEEESDSDDDEDETAELLRELEKIKRERAEEKEKIVSCCGHCSVYCADQVYMCRSVRRQRVTRRLVRRRLPRESEYSSLIVPSALD
jgi:hypothetical protein